VTDAALPIGKSDIATLIPHAGRMCLLDAVLSWDQTRICCVATSHRAPDNPLAGGGRLGAVCAVEYGAQAMAVHGRLAGTVGQRPKLGYLASVRELVCHVDRLDDLAGDLVIDAEQMLGDGSRVIYRFGLRSGERELVSGRLAVVLEAAAP
jgi:predicted hotdog family 3-hydroxylacyl-ACP dehydratase